MKPSLPSLGAARPLSRDKSDTLLLLLACLLVLAPQAANVPPWIACAVAALLLWRGWLTFHGHRLPPRRILLTLAALAMAGVYATFGTLLGRTAGVAMLALLLAFKLLEMHARRDLFVVLFLGFFLLLANFFHSQGMGIAVLTIVALVAMLTAQLSFHHAAKVPPLRARLRLAVRILTMAAPLALALFVLFPRIQGPLWRLPGDANAARSGLSDSMAPGNIAKLALSSDVAFHVRFFDPVPPHSLLYWRGVVLNHFDGRAWTRQAPEQERGATVQDTRDPVRYQVTLEPSSQRWLFALDLPQQAPRLPDGPARLTDDMQLVSGGAVDQRMRYDMTSVLHYVLQPALPPEERRADLQLPAGYDPQTMRLAAAWRGRFRDDAQRLAAVLAFFRNARPGFVYTLQPPLLGRNSVDDFLFGTRAGFCEHYASAFTVLARAMGIPARVVTGYQGGERNPVDGFLTVRQSDAHAWSEAWLAGKGWVRFDPTAAVAPDRIERSPLDTSPEEPILDGLIRIDTGRGSLAAWLRFRWDALNNGWNQWVLNYTPQRQKHLLRSLGFDNIDRSAMALLAMAAVILIVLATAVPLLKDRRPVDPLDALYRALCSRLARRGMPRRSHEGPRSYGDRLQASGALAEGMAGVRRFLEVYEMARYGATDAASRAAALRELQYLLNQIR